MALIMFTQLSAARLRELLQADSIPVCDTLASGGLGSAAEVEPPHSLAAASEGKAAPQTRYLNFPELTSAYERGADP